jgi:4-hydroxy-4-methyl-2-oxoglutarate aldolase
VTAEEIRRELNQRSTVAVVDRTTQRADPSHVHTLATFSVATIHEALGGTGLMQPRLRPVFRGVRIAGTALTCEVAPGDNSSIHIAGDVAQPGDLLVVTPTSACDDGYFGELLATHMVARGVVAVVIDAGVRDVTDLTNMSFPVWSSAISARGTVKETPGNVQVPIVCAGVAVSPGDIVIADDDGVVVVAREDALDVIAECRVREAKENVHRKLLASGEGTLDLFGLRQKFLDAGLRDIAD